MTANPGRCSIERRRQAQTRNIIRSLKPILAKEYKPAHASSGLTLEGQQTRKRRTFHVKGYFEDGERLGDFQCGCGFLPLEIKGV
jgi:hypothetical protein